MSAVPSTPVPPGKRARVATGTPVSSGISSASRWDSSNAFTGLPGRPIPKKPF